MCRQQAKGFRRQTCTTAGKWCILNYMSEQETSSETNGQESLANFVRNKIPNEETIYDLAELFKVFGDSTRTKILSCLEVKDLYVGEIAEILNMSISAVSHQLRVLRNAKLVRGTKEGKEVKYALDDNHVMMIIECGLSHLKENDEHNE